SWPVPFLLSSDRHRISSDGGKRYGRKPSSRFRGPESRNRRGGSTSVAHLVGEECTLCTNIEPGSKCRVLWHLLTFASPISPGSQLHTRAAPQHSQRMRFAAHRGADLIQFCLHQIRRSQFYPLSMCGRFTITAFAPVLEERFKALFSYQDFKPRYNAAPSQVLPVILNDDPKHIVPAFWGYIPPWDKD